MGFLKYLSYIGKGAKVISILALEISKILADGKVTVGEAMDSFEKAAGGAGMPLKIEVPYEIREMSMRVKEVK